MQYLIRNLYLFILLIYDIQYLVKAEEISKCNDHNS